MFAWHRALPGKRLIANKRDFVIATATSVGQNAAINASHREDDSGGADLAIYIGVLL